MYTSDMSKWILVIGAVIIVLLAGLYIWLPKTTPPSPSPAAVTTFDQCVAAGNPVQESYPPRCSTSDGKTFTQDVGNEMEYVNEIHVDNPRPNQIITSPLTIIGQAQGSWYFEAQFPIELQDENGTSIGTSSAAAGEDWMTNDFVPFTAQLLFTQPAHTTGKLILKNANPSGQPENDKTLTIPIKFQ